MDTAESENLSMCGNSKRENREIPAASPGSFIDLWERSENASGGTADMHAAGKSDNLVVPAKRTNNARTLAAEFVEGRGLPKRSDVPFMIAPDSEPDHAIYPWTNIHGR